MYYLGSRYYDAKVGRFINADGYVSTGTGILGNNMFAYCDNNPVNYVDNTGEFPWALLAIVALTVTVNAFVSSSIISELTKEDEKSDSLDSITFNGSTIEVLYYDVEINDVNIKDKVAATSIEAETGLFNVHSEYDKLKTYTSTLYTEASLGLIGGGIGAYFVSTGTEVQLSLFGKEVEVGLEANCGIGAEMTLGPKTEIGFSFGVGASVSFDWDP